jgi:hypothetical protein
MPPHAILQESTEDVVSWLSPFFPFVDRRLGPAEWLGPARWAPVQQTTYQVELVFSVNLNLNITCTLNTNWFQEYSLNLIKLFQSNHGFRVFSGRFFSNFLAPYLI